jgi:hypothetical protein
MLAADSSCLSRSKILDPRPIAASAKYTYYLPPEDRLNAVAAGHSVQIVLRAIPPSEKWDAERIWLKVVLTGPGWVEGILDSDPSDMPLLRPGTTIRAPSTHIINVMFDDPKKEAALKADMRREHWERCLVDRGVLDGVLPVHYLYREQPNMTRDGDEFPDSGWRIRGDLRTASDEELRAREVAYVALGAVLNRDDSWIHLIDEPIGSAYERDFERRVYVPVR